MIDQDHLPQENDSAPAPTYHQFYPLFLVAGTYLLITTTIQWFAELLLTAGQASAINSIFSLAGWAYFIGMIVWLVRQPQEVKQSSDQNMVRIYFSCKFLWIYFPIILIIILLIGSCSLGVVVNQNTNFESFNPEDSILFIVMAYGLAMLQLLAVAFVLNCIGKLLKRIELRVLGFAIPGLYTAMLLLFLITPNGDFLFTAANVFESISIPVAYLTTGLLLKKDSPKTLQA